MNSYGMDLNYSYPDYKMYLNWGVFSDANSTNTTYLFGARGPRDILNLTFYEPRFALFKVVGWLGLLNLMLLS